MFFFSTQKKKNQEGIFPKKQKKLERNSQKRYEKKSEAFLARTVHGLKPYTSHPTAAIRPKNREAQRETYDNRPILLEQCLLYQPSLRLSPTGARQDNSRDAGSAGNTSYTCRKHAVPEAEVGRRFQTPGDSRKPLARAVELARGALPCVVARRETSWLRRYSVSCPKAGGIFPVD